MAEHPFTLPYIGLGLLDESSILRDGDVWGAEYRDAAGEPYLAVYLSPKLVRLVEFDGGSRVATTSAPNINQAIGMHGSDAIGGDYSRFWQRVGRVTPMTWVQISCPDQRWSFIPAIGIGYLCIPLSLGTPWSQPTPGPIARRVGLAPFDRTTEVSSATLFRTIRGEARESIERVTVVKASMPGILVAEAVAAFFNAYGPLGSIEWRPFLLPAPAGPVARSWPSIRPVLGKDGTTMTGFAIVADRS